MTRYQPSARHVSNATVLGMDTQTATAPDRTTDDRRPRPDLSRGATLRELEAAGVDVVPLWHDERACAADVLQVGRSLAYEMARDGRLPTIALGKRRVCSVARLRALIDGAV
jgi:hypothetical protein